MKISNHLFEAYLKCKTKAFQLLTDTDNATCGFVDEISNWRQKIKDEYSRTYIKSLIAENPNDCIFYTKTSSLPRSHKYRWIVRPEICTDNFISKLPLLENPLQAAKKTKRSHYIPVRLLPSEKVYQDHKKLLAFDAMLIGKVTGHFPTVGKIIHGRERVIAKVRLTNLIPKAELIGRELKEMLEKEVPPSFTLKMNASLNPNVRPEQSKKTISVYLL